ncbi:MAG TPA: DUF4846 domain-containing protein [bacterium]
MWHHESTESLASRFDPPQGFLRLAQPEGSFGAWLRGLPLLPGNPPVQLFNGAPKQNQQPHAAVLDIDAGTEDLQQCADAIIRLRAEYLFSVHRDRDIVFHFTSGDKAAWTEWQKGLRPEVRGNRVTWKAAARPDSSYANFRRYLSTVFRYAGTLSLSKELQTVSDPSRVEIGDVFIHGGSPGHAVLVVDVAENDKGERVFILAQSYMPAQQIEILRTVLFPRSPWYTARPSGILETPEWEFQYEELKRFR